MPVEALRARHRDTILTVLLMLRDRLSSLLGRRFPFLCIAPGISHGLEQIFLRPFPILGLFVDVPGGRCDGVFC